MEVVLSETLDHRGQNVLVQAKMGQRHIKACPQQVSSGKRDRAQIFSANADSRGSAKWQGRSNSFLCGRFLHVRFRCLNCFRSLMIQQVWN
jgi:hypothetical protein